ncbi:MAG: phosphoribosylamine--glycine ligase [Vicinamibacterales bacterium]
MRLLVLGGGAREHAIVARCVGERDVDEVLVAPGNPGIAGLARLATVDPSDPEAVLALADMHQIDLTIVGPEAPLSAGIVDAFQEAGRLIVGPTRAAARLETSKAFAKAFMQRHTVPTARFLTCESAEEALTCARSGRLGFPLVVKADGLAAGKGVVIAADLAEAEAAIRQAMTEQRFGTAGDRVVLEECLTGPEVSFFVLCDGRRALPIGTAQDHKRIFDGDRGPNTGGMGAFAPSPLVDRALHDLVMGRIVDPVIRGMAEEGCPFAGFLYVGLMLTNDGPKVIEFNVRLGDPEAQVILPLIDEPLLPLLVAAAAGQLPQAAVRIAPEVRVGVVIASRGYPDASESGRPISGLDAAVLQPGVTVCHAGTARREGRIVTAGGRVLTVVGGGADFASAIARAYAGVSAIAFDGMQYRRDIGQKALLASPRP